MVNVIVPEKIDLDSFSDFCSKLDSILLHSKLSLDFSNSSGLSSFLLAYIISRSSVEPGSIKVVNTSESFNQILGFYKIDSSIVEALQIR